MNGFVLIDKPPGPSSMDAVRRIKKIFATKRVGHGGTLDPFASGLLVVAIGAVTRLLQFLPMEPKTYQFDIVFGTSTDTLDTQGSVLESGGAVPDKAAVGRVLEQFRGEISQVPPRFSALKVGGKRAYELARRNEEFELAQRSVHIFSLCMHSFEPAQARAHMEVVCSGGTYVRALARDIAHKLGTVAHAAHIRRTAAGAFSLKQAVNLSADDDEIRQAFRRPYEVLGGLCGHIATQEQCDAISHGKNIVVDERCEQEKRLFVYDNKKRLIAVAEHAEGATYHPVKVFDAV